MKISSPCQGGVEWTISADAGDDQGGNSGYADWLYDVISTSNGNLFAVGFAREDEGLNSQHPDVPGYFLMNSNGKLLKDGVIETNGHGPTGRFRDAEENANGYFAAGFRFTDNIKHALLVKINKQTLNPDLIFDFIPPGYLEARFFSVENIENNWLLVTGFAKNQQGIQVNLFVVFDAAGTFQCYQVSDNLSDPMKDAEIQASATEPDGNGGFNIYYATKELVNTALGFAPRRIDADIRIGKISFTPPCTFNFITSERFNSITQSTDLNDTEAVEPISGDVFFDYPPNEKLDKYVYGPMYQGVTSPAMQRIFDNCSETEPDPEKILNYVEDWSDGSEDTPISMVIANGKVVISAILNLMIMFKDANDLLGNDPAPGLKCTSAGCGSYESENYLWGEAYLMMFDKNNLTLSDATHLGTWSGGDFSARLIKTADGGFAVSGTVTGCPDDEPLDPIESGEHMMLVKLDANGNIEYRQHANGPGESSCGFAIAQTSDGGFVLAGNSEHEGPNDEENYCIIKFSAGDCNYQQADILPNSGNDYIVQSADELWDTDKKVSARVVVPNGKKLRIVGQTNAKITIRFADSRESSNYQSRGISGIEVQPGGKLVVNNAVLTGWDCSGAEKMWDGIAVVGQPSLPQSGSNQGDFLISYSTVKNARIGTVLGGMWAQSTTQTITMPGTNTTSTIYSSSIEFGGPFGGGKVYGISSNYEDCRRSVHFTKYDHNMSTSKFLNCNFRSNGPLADPNEMFLPGSGGLNDFVPRGTVSHVSAWSTRVQFTDCTFTGSTAIDGGARPLGIEGDDPKFVVTGGSMSTLRIGIDCRSINGGLLANTNANNVTFTNCNQSINLRGSVADKITNCHFFIPVPYSAAASAPTGIFGAGSMGTLIEKNDMHGDNPTKPGFGIVMNNTHNQGVTIRENEFFNVLTGNQFEGGNEQLKASCNDYTGMGSEAWSCLPASGILPAQGQAVFQGKKADNEFFDFCPEGSTQERHIYSEFAFAYNDKTGNSHRAMEECVTDIVGLSTSLDPTSIECVAPVDPCDPPCDRLAWFNTSSKSLDERNLALRDLIHTGFDTEGNDLPASYENAMAVLSIRGMDEDRRILVSTLTAQGRYTEAQTQLDLIPVGADAENIAMRSYLANLVTAGADAFSLPGANYATALNSLESEGTTDKVLAQNLQYLRESIYSPLIPLSKDNQERKIETPASMAVGSVIVSPNPFNRQVVFDLSQLPTGVQYQVEMSDISGKGIAKLTSPGGQFLRWNTEAVFPGAYFFIIKEINGRLVAQGKLVKITQ